MSANLPLCKAAEVDDLEELMRLLHQGAKINEQDQDYVIEMFKLRILEFSETFTGSMDGLRFIV